MKILDQLVFIQYFGWTQAAYVTVFGVTALACFLAAGLTERLQHRDTRLGLQYLLVLSGFWATGTALRLLVPDPTISNLVFLFELVVGLAAVGAWLYFVSAYTGEVYHRQRRYRRLALLVFGAIVLVKLSNPIHGLYVQTQFVQNPFPHLSVSQEGLHLGTTAFAYSLSAIGFYMLFHMLSGSTVETRPLFVLIGLAWVPVLFDALGHLEVAGLLSLSYEPLGVAAFALGTFLFANETFERARWSRHHDLLDALNQPIILVDDTDVVRDFNESAAEEFPEIRWSTGVPITEVLPELRGVSHLQTEGEGLSAEHFFTNEREGRERVFLPSVAEIRHGAYRMGEIIVCTDVTTIHRQREELLRQGDQLDGFSAAISHELRNTLTIIQGNVQLIADGILRNGDESLTRSIETAISTSHQMFRIIEDMTVMARYSKNVQNPPYIDFNQTVLEGTQFTDNEGVTVVNTSDGQIKAHAGRLKELVRQAIRLVKETGGSRLQIELSGDEIVLESDGGQVDAEDEESFFSYGTPVPNHETGMIGPNIRTLVQAHGWAVRLDETAGSGIRIVISGVESQTDSEMQQTK
ncbi:histidine kinase N-terminal 7TM domain-containing protein [Haloarchaeobius sp. DT45]|uniref:histidine kinase N-terminal 7TM domain-containing protein n=1 Tax=Haloarchaeobius sp. DT45 TaxID=3446116 RepID=UPI003F6C682C